MIEYTLLNVLMLELKVYCGPDKFYGRSNVGQYDKEKNLAPFTFTMFHRRPTTGECKYLKLKYLVDCT